MIVGGDYPAATSTTSLRNSVNFSDVFLASSVNGVAIRGFSNEGTALNGFSQHGRGVVGVSSEDGTGVFGFSTSGWAGYFDGKVHVERFIELRESGNPGPPSSNRAKLYVRDHNGTTQLCVRFPNGTIRVLASA